MQKKEISQCCIRLSSPVRIYMFNMILRSSLRFRPTGPLSDQGALGLPPLPAHNPVQVGANAPLRCPRRLENFFHFSILTAQAQVATNGLQHAIFPGLPSSAPLGSPASIFHDYRRLPNTDDVSFDQWLILCEVAGHRAYKCTWPDCLAEPFMKRHKALNHVKKHLGITKVFECITWYVGEPVVYVWNCVDASWKW